MTTTQQTSQLSLLESVRDALTLVLARQQEEKIEAVQVVTQYPSIRKATAQNAAF